MPIWSDNDISRFAQQGEQDVVSDVLCINKRYAVAITANNPVYTLPDDIINIRQVSWKGKILDPLPFTQYTEYRVTNPTGLNSVPNSSLPFAYFYDGFGENTIRFYATPTEDISGAFTDLYTTDIANAVIVEYWALPDFTGNTQRIPPYIRRRLLKWYVLYRCLTMEGPGQDIPAADFFLKLYKDGLETFRKINDHCYVAAVSNLGDERSHFVLPRPVLKSKYIWF